MMGQDADWLRPPIGATSLSRETCQAAHKPPLTAKSHIRLPSQDLQMYVNSRELSALLNISATGGPSLKAGCSECCFEARVHCMPGRDKHRNRVRRPLKF